MGKKSNKVDNQRSEKKSKHTNGSKERFFLMEQQYCFMVDPFFQQQRDRKYTTMRGMNYVCFSFNEMNEISFASLKFIWNVISNLKMSRTISIFLCFCIICLSFFQTLEALNTLQLQPHKYIFIYHRLALALLL